MRKIISLFVAAAALLFATPAAAAVTLQVDPTTHKLTGATGVVVNGVTYNVAFGDSTCAAAFDGCDSNSDFVFTTTAQVSVAAQALLNQVLLDTASGDFDSTPYLTSGCDSNRLSLCFVAIPYMVTNGNFTAGGAQNWGSSSFNADVAMDGSTTSTSINYSSDYNLNAIATGTFARFCLQGTTCTIAQPQVPSVPEPATWGMMLLGFGGIGMTMRRKRSSASFRQIA